jgi:predicted PurR-regulated permease PerM
MPIGKAVTPPSHDLTRTLLAVLSIGGLIAASAWIFRPFLLPTVWATTIVVSTWPLMLRAQALLGGRRGLAVGVMTVAMLLVFLIPCSLATAALVGNSERIVGWLKSLTTWQVPPPPDFVSGIPWIGEKLAAFWNEVAVRGAGSLMPYLTPYANHAARWLLSAAGSAGHMVLQVLLTIVIAVLLYANGDTAGSGVLQFARRLMGPNADRVVRLAGQTIRGVALGVVVTALVQALLAGIGLAVCGIPLVPILTSVCFILALAQIGVLPVLLPAVIWLFWSGHAGWGTALLVWSVPVLMVDNILRPILIRRGADLPLLLVFTGVVGGLLAFGIVGIFVGPVVLTVCYTLLKEWVANAPSPAAAGEARPGVAEGTAAEG